MNASCPAANFTNLAANVTATNASVTGGNACLVVNRVDPVLTKAFTPATIDQGGTSTLVFTLTNAGTNPAQAGINFTDTLPAGVTVAGTPNVQSNCPAGGALVNNPAFVTTGAASITVTGAAMTAATASCEIRVNVTAAAPGAYTNTAANIAGAANVNTTGLTATLTVQSVPPLTKAFGRRPCRVGGTSTLVFTINNTAAGAVNRAGISFTDTLPAGIAIANPPVPTTNGNCGAPAFTAANNTQPFTAANVSGERGPDVHDHAHDPRRDRGCRHQRQRQHHRVHRRAEQRRQPEHHGDRRADDRQGLRAGVDRGRRHLDDHLHASPTRTRPRRSRARASPTRSPTWSINGGRRGGRHVYRRGRQRLHRGQHEPRLHRPHDGRPTARAR